MIRAIDNLLNKISMYMLVLYALIFLLGSAVVLSLLGILAYDPFAILVTVAFLVAACAITNWIFARTFGVPTNVESAYITALILALIITPLQTYSDLWFLGWAAVLSMASKYVLAVQGKHPFNPAAFAVALTYFAANQSASWWVGNAQMLPLVLISGLLVVRKLRRFDLVLSFLATAFATILAGSLFSGGNLLTAAQRLLLYSPYLFFAFFLLTEPLTTPPARKQRLIYGGIVGFLFTPAFHLGAFYVTPELALLIGNLYSYLVSPKTRLILKLKEKVQLAPDVYEFIFAPNKKLAYSPGQFMEWTLGHPDPDIRGNRRYFTLASAPTEGDLRLGIKFYQGSSSFKKALLSMDERHEIIASQLAGEFVLPPNPRQPCVLIAGGIGITPFRSMIQYLLDTHQRRPILLLYINKTVQDIVYKNIFDLAEKELGIRTVYTLTESGNLPPNWQGKAGRITPQWLKKLIPGYRTFLFYISGPVGMVNAYRDMLHEIGVEDAQIRIDYFSGLS